jgi:hypothetical protein
LQALPRWPARGPMLRATAALQRLRSGTGPASAAGVPEATVRDISERSRSCEYAICLVAVRVLATRLQSEQPRFRSLPQRSQAALLRDTEEVKRITGAADRVRGQLTEMITTSPVRSGLLSLRDVGDGLAALSLAASRITLEGEWQ